MTHFSSPSFFTDELDREFQLYAASKYPQEACAFIVESKLVPVSNISDTPEETFKLSLKETKFITKAQGFLHSHPNGPIEPSKRDMESQIASGIPFGITATNDHGGTQTVWFGEHTLDLPLENRPFVHGVLDCYDIIRSAYWQKQGIKLKNYPRWSYWWNSESALYEDNFTDCGFVEVDDLKQYDVLLMKIGNTQSANHAAVYMGDNLIVHHLTGKISKFDLLPRWGRFVYKTLRYNEAS